MAIARGLPNTKGERECLFFGSFTQAMRIIRSGYIATTAGDNGAMNAWRDDDGVLRAYFCRRMITIEDRTFKTVKEFRGWMKIWLPKLA